MASEAPTPDPRSGIRRRSSQLGALLAFILPTVFGLWVVFGFSNPTNAVKGYKVVPRAPYKPALPPETASLVGQPPTSTYAQPKNPSASVRIIDVVPGAVELRVAGKIIRTIPSANKATTTLDSVTRAIGDPTWIAEPQPGVFTVSAALVFRQGIGLSANVPTTTTVHFGSAPGIFLAIDGRSNSQISGVSFDAPSSPWKGALSYRPFLLFDEDAVVNVSGAHLTGLGWDWNMSYGISWMRGATGSLVNSTVDENFIGFYCQQVSGVKVIGNTFARNHLYGIDPHTGSNHLLVMRNVATHNDAHGIIFANNVSNSVLLGNVSSYNGESGIVMYQGSDNNTIKANVIVHNAGDGIVLTVHSTGASLVDNVVEHNRIGVLSEDSDPIGTLSANTVTHNTQAEKGVSLSTGTNQVDLTETGIILSPPPPWHWVFTWVLWPLTFAYIFYIFYRRRLELRAGWHVAQTEEGLPTDPQPHRWRDLMAGIRRALAIQVKTRDSIYQPAAPIPLAFEGPPPVAEITADELEPVTIGAHGEEILSSGNEAGTDPGDRRFRPDVQGLRALAVTLVVLYHAGVPWLSGGYVGVDVFFVVSGFVITGLLLRERSNAGKTSLLGFYARRARRILPAATLVTVFTVLATYHWLGFIQGARAAISGRWAAVFLANLNDIRMGTNYFSQGAQTSPFLHYWSLSVEEQFYVVFPFLFVGVALLFRQRSIRAKLAIILAVIIAGSLTLSVIQTHSSPVVAYFSPFTRAWELALGGLLASSGPVLRRLNQVPATVITWLGLAGIITASITYSNSTSYPGIAVALPVLATALVIAGGSVAPRFGSEFVLGRWLGIKGGDISYSLYLWHFPILVIAAEAATSPLSAPTRAALVLLAVVLSIITNLAFENPIRHASSLSRSTARSLGLGAALIAGAVLFTSALATIPGGSASGGSDSTAQAASASLTQLQGQIAQGARLKSLPSGLVPQVQDVTAQGILSAGIPERCVASSTSTTSVTPCTLGDQHSTKTMVLLGDSQATMWAGGFNLAAQKAGWKLVVLAKDGCPPWLQHYLTPGLSPYPQCDAWHSFTSRTIAQLRPQLVIATGAAGPLGTTPAAAVTRLVTALKADGSRVGILSNTPWFNSPNVPQPPDCLAQHSSSLQICNLSYRSFLSTHRSIRSMLQDGASGGGAMFINLDRLFCTAQTCPVVVGNHEVYFDLYHISAAYSTFVAEPLGSILTSEVKL